MCGIAGLAGRRPVNENTVHKMTNLLFTEVRTIVGIGDRQTGPFAWAIGG